MNLIPYGKQNITQKDIYEVVKVLKSYYLTQGPEIKKFEDALTDPNCKLGIPLK